MITSLEWKPFLQNDSYREGKVYCKLWDREIEIAIYDEAVTLEYAEKCAEAMNAMSEELVDAICKAAKRYLLKAFYY